MNQVIRTTEKTAAAATITTAGIHLTVTPTVPVKLVRVVVVVTTGVTVAAETITVQRRPIAGTAANQVTLGAFTVPIAAAGSVFYFEDFDLAEINPGEDLTVASSGASTAGAAHIGVELIEDPFVGSRVAGATLAAAA